MKEGNKIDEIIDFKRTYGAIQAKDWKKYPLAAKRIKFYFLRMNKNFPDIEVEDSIISFHSKEDLIAHLKSVINISNKSDIEDLINQIQDLGRGILKENGQTRLTEFNRT